MKGLLLAAFGLNLMNLIDFSADFASILVLSLLRKELSFWRESESCALVLLIKLDYSFLARLAQSVLNLPVAVIF